MPFVKDLIHKLQSKSKMDGAANRDSSIKHEQKPIQDFKDHNNTSLVTIQDIYQYRYQHGVNLGSIFVLEKWLFPSMFEKNAQGGSELDAVRASLAAHGLEATIKKWENHWSKALTDKDIDFLVNEAHCNTIRLPIGYYTLGPEFCAGTPFEGDPAEVYLNAWSNVMAICKKLANHGIGVLLDMHALPGGANKDSHSGTSNKTAGLWAHEYNLSLAKHSLLFIAQEISSGKIPNCVGLQLVNEVAWQAKGMYDFYSMMQNSISEINPTLPLYISDAWDLDTALKYTRSRNTLSSQKNLLIIDTHKYYTFSEKHTSKTPQEIIRLLPTALSSCSSKSSNVHNDGAAPVYIGEYSCVMDAKSWSHISDENEKEILIKEFGNSQCHYWHQDSCGSAFWTLKMDWMPGGGWGFVGMVRKGAIKAPGYMTLSFDEVDKKLYNAQTQKEELKQGDVAAHRQHWESQDPKQKSEHWRFGSGWEDGWNEACAFFGMRKEKGLGTHGADRIGCLDGWIRKRMIEKGQGDFMGWKYEHGLRAGVGNAEGILLKESC